MLWGSMLKFLKFYLNPTQHAVMHHMMFFDINFFASDIWMYVLFYAEFLVNIWGSIPAHSMLSGI